MTGYFILPGGTSTPFVYRVRRIRDGGAYCLRSVDVYQNTEMAKNMTVPCFVATVSFKRDERNSKKSIDFGHQNAPEDHVRKTYASVLEGKQIMDHPRAPGSDAEWWYKADREDWNHAADVFPGIDLRKVNMDKYNGIIKEGNMQNAGNVRQLHFYRVLRDEGDMEEDLNLDACAHLYASDRNGLFLIPRALGYSERYVAMGTLSHTVVFHHPASHLKMTKDSGESKWFVQEAWTSHSGEGRGCHESRLWEYEGGRILATTMQDGMIRIPRDKEEERWKPDSKL